jgi:hypothetical protein
MKYYTIEKETDGFIFVYISCLNRVQKGYIKELEEMNKELTIEYYIQDIGGKKIKYIVCGFQQSKNILDLVSFLDEEGFEFYQACIKND